MELKNKKWTEEQFLEIREKVLASWKTGNDNELDFENAIEYLNLCDKIDVYYAKQQFRNNVRIL